MLVYMHKEECMQLTNSEYLEISNIIEFYRLSRQRAAPKMKHSAILGRRRFPRFTTHRRRMFWKMRGPELEKIMTERWSKYITVNK